MQLEFTLFSLFTPIFHLFEFPVSTRPCRLWARGNQGNVKISQATKGSTKKTHRAFGSQLWAANYLETERQIKDPAVKCCRIFRIPPRGAGILTPSTGEARQGQGGSLPPALQCGMRGTPPKHNVRGFGGIFGSCSGFRRDVLYPWSSCSTFAWKQFSLLEAQPWCWFTSPEAKLCCFCFILPLHHLSQSLLQLLSSVSSEFKTALALWLLNS